jgi:hypothetical protein
LCGLVFFKIAALDAAVASRLTDSAKPKGEAAFFIPNHSKKFQHRLVARARQIAPQVLFSI